MIGGARAGLLLRHDGTVWTWGADFAFRLGQGHALALGGDGTVWAWGQNDYGQIGDGTLTNASTPLQVKGPGGIGLLSGIVMVSGGDCHSAALRSDGTVWTWGCNHHNGFNPPPVGMDPVGQLGNGDNTYTDEPYPVQVVGGAQGGPFLESILLVAARDYHNYALARDGTLYSWGSNLNGQLGDGACCLPSTVPLRVSLP